MIEVEVVDLKRIATKIEGRREIFHYAYYLILGEKNGNRKLPIVIGEAEAMSIFIALSSERTFPRPLSHDLIFQILKTFNVKFVYAAIVALEQNTFYAELVLETEGKRFAFDARPSDAIAIALRANCRIFVDRELFNNLSVSEEELKAAEHHEEQQPSGKPQSPPSQEKTPSKKLEDMSIEELKRELERAVAREDYELAARIRDLLRQKGGEGSSYPGGEFTEL